MRNNNMSDGSGSGSRGISFLKGLFTTTTTPTASAACLTLLLLFPSCLLFAEAKKAVVVVPVADVWSEPGTQDPKKRETQVLFGEKVLVYESSGTWLRIQAIEQPEFSHHRKWEGYPGWVSLPSIGYQEAPGIPQVNVAHPENPIEFAESLIGTPYLWGGLSKENGFDCSGLVHLAYRKNLKKIPRDAHEQWMKAKPVKRQDLKPGDLIFSASKKKPKKITHVTLYLGKEQLIEAPQTGMVVREVSFKEKYGRDLLQIESGDTVGDRVLYFGTYLNAPQKNK